MGNRSAEQRDGGEVKIIESSTPAGPHELGDSNITILLTNEEYDAFMSLINRDDDTPKPKLEALMKRKAPWDE